MIQRLRICLPLQGTLVQSLVWEGPTCRGVTGAKRHNSQSLFSSTRGAAPMRSCIPQLESSPDGHHQRKPLRCEAGKTQQS